MNDREIFQTLVKMGKLTPADIREIFGLTDEMKKFIDFLQLMVGTEDGELYIQEKSFAACWSSPCHIKWIDIAERALKVLELSPIDGLDIITSAFNLIQQTRSDVLLFIALYVYPEKLDDLLADEEFGEQLSLPFPELDVEPSPPIVDDVQMSFLDTLDALPRG